MTNKKFKPAPAGKHYIFVRYITRGGKIIYASQYGLRAFCILVDD